ncbi:TPA: transcriptional regulator [Escherichia coli]|nr:transcriptional regulator [Escherichia coli]HAX1982835.1 transcriptional regulator [Escherichia coli]HAX2345289.1 transcriptional regulator [Escherichia coli]HBN7237031.1 transcriptional regulator [Escherichia coli]HBN7443566.1 transcriptional regulator [Escherichia coli]
MIKKGITYGLPAEVWPRDYQRVEYSLMFMRKKRIPVKVTLNDGSTFSMYVSGLKSERHKLDLCPTPFDQENRIRLPLKRVSLIESGIAKEEIDSSFRGKLTVCSDNNNYIASRRDFFRICRKSYREKKSLRIFLSDGRVIEGVSRGVDGCSVTLRLEKDSDDRQRQLIVFFDWVERIIAFKQDDKNV